MGRAMASLTPPYQSGDIIRHTGAFLRSTGQIAGAPINGEVQAVNDAPDKDLRWQRLTVEWSDGTRGTIIAANVEFCPRGRALTERRRRDRGLG